MKPQSVRLYNSIALALVLPLGLTVITMMALSGRGGLTARAAPADELHVCPVGCAFSSVQDAVDAAPPGAVIKVAEGTYSGVTSRNGITQVVYISKSVTIQGGYSTSDWTTPDPDVHTTTLDAEGWGRVLVIMGPLTATIDGLRVINGDATGLPSPLSASTGGGVFAQEADVTISNCTIQNCTASSTRDFFLGRGYGGGVYAEQSQLTLLGNTLSQNLAAKTGHGYGGGVLLAYSPHAVMRGNVISGNVGAATSNGQGGGMEVRYSENVTIERNAFIGNTGSGGANYYGGGLYLLATDHVRVTRNLFEANVGGTAWSWGGGLFVDLSDDVVIDANVIQGNVASTFQGWGGGLYAAGCQRLDISRNIIRDNMGTSNPAQSSWGGGLYIERGADITLTNNAVLDNQANASGSGLVIGGSSPRLLHNTFARNSGGDGSAIYVDWDEHWSGEYFAAAALTNTVLVSHGVGISVAGGNTVTVNGILWHDTPITVSASPTAVTVLQNQMTGDPAFAADGYHITLDSAAADQGTQAVVWTDIDGDPRPAGRGPDLGADELPGLYLPLLVREE